MKPAEQYILNQPEPFRTILLHLQVIIEATLPEVELLFKWRVPFYYIGKSPICYLNVTKGYVDVGFWNAQYFTKHIEKLESDKRKYVKSLRYRNQDEIDEQVFVEILKQAYVFRNEKFITN
ncbi:DUF1801 domain-containing protein [Aquimarina sp. 2201CG14-23]|uniref:DUF1801 domain-containing protein n=1 Tax=Aquimarina mycalae TaxID=3040073 RepID=UPI002477CE76|nr:DUF1801 domain-containing protein [Aquimarina sp. 2201CG14-23]MDH7444991.1 DUF1801 domain-containing protein [Aquimarina sp. 2201CG14-23]